MQKELTGWQRLLEEDPTGILKDEKLVEKLIKHLETLKSDAIDNFRADNDSSIWKKDIVAINTAINIIGIAYNIENLKKYLITNFENKTKMKILIHLDDWTEEEIENAKKSEVARWLNEPHLYRLLDADELTDEEYQMILDEVDYD